MVFAALLSLVAVNAQAAPAQAAPAADTVAQAYFQFVQGLTLEGRGDVEGAIAAYRKAIELSPKSGEIHAELATLYARENRVSEALTEAQAALGVDPDNRLAHRLLGFIQTAQAERPGPGVSAETLANQAVSHLEQSLASGVRDSSAQLTLGRLYVQLGKHDQAIATLKSFLLEQPDYVDGIMLLAEAYDDSGRKTEAAAALQSAIDLDPEQTRARAWLADLYERSNKWKDAATTWGDLVKLGPRARTYRSRYATALVNAGDVAAGRQVLVDITKDSPRDISAWFLLSQVERQAGNSQGAEDAARHIAEIDPDDARGPLAMAEAKAARGDFKGAASALDARVTAAREDDVRNGTYARMAASLADVLQEGGDKRGAITVLEAALKRDPTDSALQFGLAAAYDRNAQIDDAERAFRALIAKEPDNADALNYLGYMLAEHDKKLDEAVELVKRALVVEPENPSYLDSLGWVYFKRGAFDNARDPLEKAAAARPDNSVIQEHLGDLYFQTKRYREAMAAFDRALAGDKDGVDVAAVTKKRDRAKELAGK